MPGHESRTNIYHQKSKTDSSDPSLDNPLQRLELDILVVGQAGSGKSSTGNSLLLRRAFKTSNSSSYGNLNIQSAWNDYKADNGKLYRIKVTDGASPEDIDPTIEAREKKACKNIAKLVTECPRGFHVIVITVRLGTLFTDEYTVFEKYLVRHCLNKHGVVVITGVDDLIDDDLDDKERASCFKDWCDRQTGNLKRCFEKCKGRIVLFDNKTKDPSLRKKQLDMFLSVVDELAKERYTNQLFHIISKQHKNLIEQLTVREEIRGYISAIQGKFSICPNVNFMQRVDLKEIEGNLKALLLKVEGEKEEQGQDARESKSTDGSNHKESERQTEETVSSDVTSQKENDKKTEETGSSVLNEFDNERSGTLGNLVRYLQRLLGEFKDKQMTAKDEKEVFQCINAMVETAALPQDPELYVALRDQVRHEQKRGHFWNAHCCIL